MTATTLHASEITFNCPPWCISTRAEHLECLGELGGKVAHFSHYVVGAPGCIVSLSSITYPDGTPGDDSDGVLVEIDASSVNLTPDQARALVQALIVATAEAER